MEEDRRIPAKKRGNRLGFWFFKVSLRLFGLRGAYGLLYVVCLHYLLFDGAAVRGAFPYIVRRFPGESRRRSLLRVYRLFRNQGMQLIDRYAVLSGAVRFDFELRGADRLEEAVAHPENGLVLLTAHVGNWQAALTTFDRLEKTVNLVMRPEDNEAVRRALRLSVNTRHLRIISPEGQLGGVVEIMSALGRGEIVSFMGDRPFDFAATDIRFLGDTARFPIGAFQIAAAAGCPVQVLLCARTGHRRYLVDTSNLLFPVYQRGVPKQEQLRCWVQQFADILETFVEAHPYQCFLFTDIWRLPTSGSAPRCAPEPVRHPPPR